MDAHCGSDRLYRAGGDHWRYAAAWVDLIVAIRDGKIALQQNGDEIRRKALQRGVLASDGGLLWVDEYYTTLEPDGRARAARWPGSQSRNCEPSPQIPMIIAAASPHEQAWAVVRMASPAEGTGFEPRVPPKTEYISEQPFSNLRHKSSRVPRAGDSRISAP